MVKYENGKIYRLVCNVTGLQYIGSTCSTLSHRKNGHKTHYNRFLQGKTNYISSCDVLKGGDYDIVLIENYPCNDKNELHARERYFIETMECVNKAIPNRERKEWYEHNKDEMKEKRKKYYEENKSIINKKCNEYRTKNKEKIQEQKKVKIVCECGSTVSRDKIQSHRRTEKHKKLLSTIN